MFNINEPLVCPHGSEQSPLRISVELFENCKMCPKCLLSHVQMGFLQRLQSHCLTLCHWWRVPLSPEQKTLDSTLAMFLYLNVENKRL